MACVLEDFKNIFGDGNRYVDLSVVQFLLQEIFKSENNSEFVKYLGGLIESGDLKMQVSLNRVDEFTKLLEEYVKNV